jgi:hypothetical protein
MTLKQEIFRRSAVIVLHQMVIEDGLTISARLDDPYKQRVRDYADEKKLRLFRLDDNPLRDSLETILLAEGWIEPHAAFGTERAEQSGVLFPLAYQVSEKGKDTILRSLQKLLGW